MSRLRVYKIPLALTQGAAAAAWERARKTLHHHNTYQLVYLRQARIANKFEFSVQIKCKHIYLYDPISNWRIIHLCRWHNKIVEEGWASRREGQEKGKRDYIGRFSVPVPVPALVPLPLAKYMKMTLKSQVDTVSPPDTAKVFTNRQSTFILARNVAILNMSRSGPSITTLMCDKREHNKMHESSRQRSKMEGMQRRRGTTFSAHTNSFCWITALTQCSQVHLPCCIPQAHLGNCQKKCITRRISVSEVYRFLCNLRAIWMSSGFPHNRFRLRWNRASVHINIYAA